MYYYKDLGGNKYRTIDYCSECEKETYHLDEGTGDITDEEGEVRRRMCEECFHIREHL